MKLTQEILKELMDYNPETGIFVWKERDIIYFNHCKKPEFSCRLWNSRMVGKVSGTIFKTKNKFYYATSLSCGEKFKRYYMHRLAWMYMYGKFPNDEIDHLDGDGLNNKISNLVLLDHCGNLKNQKMRSTNTSGFNGVSYDKARNKWIVQIWNNSKRVFSKRFESFDEAVLARKDLDIEYNYSKRHGRVK